MYRFLFLLKYLLITAMVLAGLWWIVRPWYVHEFGQPVKVRVIRTWDTSWQIGIIFYWESLSGVELQVIPLSREAYQVRQYCPYLSIESLKQGALIDARYHPLLPTWVVVMDSTCDIHIAVFTGVWLVIISSFFLWKKWTVWKERKWIRNDKYPQDNGWPT